MDLTFFMVTGACFVALSLVRWRWWAQPDNAARSAHSFARKVDLALADRTEEVVTARLVRRERAAVVGGGLGALAAAALAAMTTGDAAVAFRVVGVMLGFVVGHAMGFGVVAWRETVRRAANGPRLARATVPTHDDYVARHERVGAWAWAGLALLGGGALLLLGRSEVLDGAFRTSVPPGLAVGVMLLPALAVAVDEVLARRLLGRPQVASTPFELAWDDALRARTLRDMVIVPLSAGYGGLATLVLVVENHLLDGSPGSLAADVMNGVFGLLLLGGLATPVVSMVIAPEARFRRRLWPSDRRRTRDPLPTWGSAR